MHEIAARTLLIISLLLFLTLFCQLTSAQEPAESQPPLPDLETLGKEVKKKLISDRLLLSQYTFKLDEVVNMINKKGEVKKSETKSYEVFPSLEDKLTYRRLISEDGKPVSQKKLEKQDRKHQKKIEKRLRKLGYI